MRLSSVLSFSAEVKLQAIRLLLEVKNSLTSHELQILERSLVVQEDLGLISHFHLSFRQLENVEEIQI